MQCIEQLKTQYTLLPDADLPFNLSVPTQGETRVGWGMMWYFRLEDTNLRALREGDDISDSGGSRQKHDQPAESNIPD